MLKALVTFTVPFLLANVLQSLYGAVDLFVVGQFCDAQAVAAVSTGTQVTQIVTSLVTGLTLGGTILVGNYTGMERWDKVKEAIGTTLSVFAVVAVLLTALMLLFEAPLLTVLNTPAESFEATMDYVAICAWGNFFICGYNALSAILRGYGDSVRPLYFVAVACVANVILDVVFVAGFHLGASGTALATVISQGLSMFLGIAYLKRHAFLFDFKPASFRIARPMAKELARVGIPISFQELMVRISFLYLTAVMNGCGVYAAAVVGIGAKYDVFSMLSATSVANALAALTAQNTGAGKPARAWRSLWYGLAFALGAAFVFWTWAQWNPESMIRLFSDDPGVIGGDRRRGALFPGLQLRLSHGGLCVLPQWVSQRPVEDPVDHGQLYLRRPVPSHPPGVVCGEPFRPGPGDAGDGGPGGVGDDGGLYFALCPLGREEAACL